MASLKRATPNHHQRTNQGNDSSKETSPDLPQEIILEILSLLAVKSLLRFRCVHKSWRSIISGPLFINSHLKLSMKSQNIVPCFRNPDNKKCCHLHSLFYESCFTATDLNCSFFPEKFPEFLLVLGSCNGLLCIATESHCRIWNPSTRESKMLPDLVSLPAGGFVGFDAYGFGYDNSNDDYKVVLYDFGHCPARKIQGNVYSLRTNSWRKIQANGGFYLYNPGIYISGVLHWKASPFAVYNPKRIVSFDLAKETYGEILQPNYGDESWLWILGVLEGCLCVLADNKMSVLDVWIMTEYGVEESWTKLLTITYAENPALFRYGVVSLELEKAMHTPLTLSVSKNGKILLQGVRALVLYKHQGETFKYLEFDAIEDMHTFGDSLISPNAYSRDC